MVRKRDGNDHRDDHNHQPAFDHALAGFWSLLFIATTTRDGYLSSSAGTCEYAVTRNFGSSRYFSFRRSPNLENLQEFASSTNGDRWFLGINPATNREVVVHRGNPSSGGHETTMPVSLFLNQRPFRPEHQALDLLLADRRAAESEASATRLNEQ